MTFTITRADESDWWAYQQIRLRSLLEAPEAYGSSHERELGLTEDEWRVRAASGRLILARDDEHGVVGTAAGLLGEDGHLDLVGMFVAAEVRGRGCAELLLNAVIAVAREDGATRVVLHVTDGNIVASRCYTRYGFVETGRRWPMERDPSLTEIELAYAL